MTQGINFAQAKHWSCKQDIPMVHAWDVVRAYVLIKDGTRLPPKEGPYILPPDHAKIFEECLTVACAYFNGHTMRDILEEISSL